MAFNQQETISIFDGEDVDIIGKCLEIAVNEKLNSTQVLMRLDYFKLKMSFAKILKAFGGNTSNLGIEIFNEICDFYGITKEYGKYVLEYEFNFYANLYRISTKNNIKGLTHPAEKIKELARYKYLIEHPQFRGKYIELKTELIEDKEYDFVYYDGKEYKFDEFLLAMYPNKRVNRSIVFFPDTIANLLKVGPTQRIKMKYDILAYHFGLPIISDEDKNDLYNFLSKYYDNKTIQKYYRRFNWDSGLEKMVAFGADLDISGKVDGAIEGFWCYEYMINGGKAIVTGIDISLKEWLHGVIYSVSKNLYMFNQINNISNNHGIEIIKNIGIMSLYYQKGKRVALPDIQLGRPIKDIIDTSIDTVCRKMKSNNSIDILDVVNKCFSTVSIQDYQSESYQFTVDFERDVMIIDTKSAARAQQAIEQVYTIARERLIGLQAGEKVTTQQLRDRGYKNNNGKAINTLVEYGILQKGVLRGSFIMLKDF